MKWFRIFALALFAVISTRAADLYSVQFTPSTYLLEPSGILWSNFTAGTNIVFDTSGGKLRVGTSSNVVISSVATNIATTVASALLTSKAAATNAEIWDGLSVVAWNTNEIHLNVGQSELSGPQSGAISIRYDATASPSRTWITNIVQTEGGLTAGFGFEFNSGSTNSIAREGYVDSKVADDIRSATNTLMAAFTSGLISPSFFWDYLPIPAAGYRLTTNAQGELILFYRDSNDEFTSYWTNIIIGPNGSTVIPAVTESILAQGAASTNFAVANSPVVVGGAGIAVSPSYSGGRTNYALSLTSFGPTNGVTTTMVTNIVTNIVATSSYISPAGGTWTNSGNTFLNGVVTVTDHISVNGDIDSTAGNLSAIDGSFSGTVNGGNAWSGGFRGGTFRSLNATNFLINTNGNGRVGNVGFTNGVVFGDGSGLINLPTTLTNVSGLLVTNGVLFTNGFAFVQGTTGTTNYLSLYDFAGDVELFSARDNGFLYAEGFLSGGIGIGTNVANVRLEINGSSRTSGTNIAGYFAGDGSGVTNVPFTLTSINSNTIQAIAAVEAAKVTNTVNLSRWLAIGTNALTTKIESNINLGAWANLGTTSITYRLLTNVWLDSWGSLGTNALSVKQQGSVNLTNWSGTSTNMWVTTNSPWLQAYTVNGNLLQPGSANLTNWSLIPTGSMANVTATTFLTNWANTISNLVQTKQQGSANLTNWSAIPVSSVANVSAVTYLTNAIINQAVGSVTETNNTTWITTNSTVGSYVIDMNRRAHVLEVTSALTLVHATNLPASGSLRSSKLILRNYTVGNIAITIGSSWKWLGNTNNPPTTIGAGKVMEIELDAYDSAQTNIIAGAAGQN